MMSGGKDELGRVLWGKSRSVEYPKSAVRSIVEEFYENKGGTIPDEEKKARKLLEYIQALQVKYAKKGRQMSEKDIMSLGFDVDELKNGRIRASRSI